MSCVYDMNRGDVEMSNVGFLVAFFIVILLVIIFALIAVVGAVSGAVAGIVDEEDEAGNTVAYYKNDKRH